MHVKICFQILEPDMDVSSRWLDCLGLAKGISYLPRSSHCLGLAPECPTGGQYLPHFLPPSRMDILKEVKYHGPEESI